MKINLRTRIRVCAIGRRVRSTGRMATLFTRNIFPVVPTILFVLGFGNMPAQLLNPTHAGSITNGAGGALLSLPYSVYVSGNYAYVASFSSNSLEIVDISNPAAPVHKGSLTDGTGGALLNGASSVYVSGSYAYVVSFGSPSYLEIVDVSNPATPTHKGSIVDGAGGANLSGAASVFVLGSYAYIASFGSNVLEIVDVSNPATPTHKGSIADGGSASLSAPNCVYVSGNYAYVASFSSNALEIVDISNPAAPAHKGRIANGSGGALLNNPYSVFVSGNYAYVTSGSNALEIIDISNPAAPTHKGSIANGSGGALLNAPYSVFVSGNYAYVTAGGSSALEIIDISNPAAPTHKGSIADGSGGALLSSPNSVYVSGNYSYVCSGGSNALEIIYTQFPQTINNFSAALPAKVYGDIPFTLGATSSSGLAVTYTSSNTSVATVIGNTVTVVGAGATTITATQPGNITYSAAANVPQTLTISPAPIVVTVNNAARAYGSANPTFSYSYSGFVNGDNASAFQLAFSAPATSATPASAVGTYAINVVGGNVGPNYSTVVTGGGINAGTLTIAKAPLTVTANNKSRAYGASNPTFDFTYTGFVNSETSSVLTAMPTGSTTATATSGVGSYAITPSGALAVNYSFTYLNGTLSVTAAALTVTANNKSRAYGASNPTFDFTYTGFANSETSSVLTTQPIASSSATSTSGAGTYSIVPSGGSASNYSLSYVNGTLTVTPAPIVVTVNNAARAYGSANPTFSYSYSGFVNGDNASAFQLALSSPATSATSASAVGTYAINVVGGNVGPNYSTIVTGGGINAGTLTITKAPLAVTANDKTRVYGSPNPTFDFNYSGFVNGENATALTTQPTASTTTNLTSAVGSYPITLSGAFASNYSFTYTSGTLSITKAPLTVTSNSKSRVYGASNPGFDFNYSGFVNGETSIVLTSLPVGSTSATVTSNTGTYSIVPSGGSANNYTLLYANGTLTITKANQTITFTSLAPTFQGVSAISLTASSSSGLPIIYTSSNPPVATVSGSIMTILGTGTTDITASQSGNSNFNPATSVVQTQIVKVGQTINFASLTPKLITDVPFNLSATSSSGLGVTYTSSDINIATVSGNMLTIVSAGSVDITAHQAGDATYLAANDVTQTLVINKLTQSITFNVLPSKLINDAPFSLTATVSSGLAVSYISSNPSVATVSGATVTILGAGTTTITASQAGNANYKAATDVTQTLTVNKTDQTITFGALATKLQGDQPFPLTATSSSALVPTFSITSGPATVSGNTITLTGAGTVVVKASQAGNANYNAAADVSQSFCVTPSKPTINFSITNPQIPVLTSSTTQGNQWFFNGAAVSNSTAVSLNADHAGSYTVQVTITGCASPMSDPKAVVVTAIEKGAVEFSCYPNPTEKEITIQWSASEKVKQVQIMDMAGRVMNSGGEELVNKPISIDHYSTGMFIIRVTSERGVSSVKFIKR